jgi:hypothetical protein
MPDLLSATVADGMTALLVLLAMSLGLIVPKVLIDRICQRQALARSQQTKEHADLR